jgi:hypothetical protein
MNMLHSHPFYIPTRKNFLQIKEIQKVRSKYFNISFQIIFIFAKIGTITMLENWFSFKQSIDDVKLPL